MKMPEPFISIVIPTYNRAQFLKANIPRLCALDYENYEIVVVDDGSTDDTPLVMADLSHERLRVFRKENGERAAARNYGAKQAIGDYITFLDSDDILYDDALQKAAEAIIEKKFPFFLHLAYDIGTPDKISKTVIRLKDNNPYILVKGNPLSCMGVFIRREVFQSHQFNEDRNLSASEDWEFWMRLAAFYGLRTDNRIVGRLIEHKTRSVVTASEEKLVMRKTLAIRYAFEDETVRTVFGKYKRSIAAYWDTYIALHLVIDGLKSRALYYFLGGIRKDIGCLFTRRALVIIKFLLQKRNEEDELN